MCTSCPRPPAGPLCPGTEGLVNIIRKFADDTKLGNKAASDQDRADLQAALDKMCTWADEWGMSFNVKKCKVMHLGRANKEHTYTMNGHTLEKTEEEREIGVIMSKSLKPHAQCTRAARTAQTVLGQLTRAFHYRDRHIFTRLYMQYVRPHLEFASPAWSPWLEADIECLEKVQRRAVQQVSGLTAATYEGRLAELGLTTLTERRHQQDMLQAYKILSGKDKVRATTWFAMASESASERVTRAAADPLSLKIPMNRLEVRKNFFSQRVPDQWNKIPLSVRQSATAASLRAAYAAHRREPAATASR